MRLTTQILKNLPFDLQKAQENKSKRVAWLYNSMLGITKIRKVYFDVKGLITRTETLYEYDGQVYNASGLCDHFNGEEHDTDEIEENKFK